MIHLDTNYLVDLCTPGSAAAAEVRQWLANNEEVATSTIAWSEFVSGPVSQKDINAVEYILSGRLTVFSRDEAIMAGGLFNQTGRKRGSRMDCFIAATAICAGAQLATQNKNDFSIFIHSGLRLI
jgi:predicted nucleic acid-binding protein